MQIKTILLAVLLFAGAITLHAAEKPNILLIYTDDHGWADLGAQGVDKNIRTPNLDQLVRDGVRFARGYVSAPQCVPSRAGVITGRYQQKFDMESNGKGPLPLAELTIAERLKPAGYLTGQVGKWHLDLNGGKQSGKPVVTYPEHMPHGQGFDEYWCGSMRQFLASHDLSGQPFADAPRVVNDHRFRVVVQTEAALSFLDRRAAKPEQPWFLYLAWFAPHVPLESPEPWFSQTPASLPKERRQALAMIAAMDDGLGRIRAKLKEMGQERNTLIFFISDNGAPLKAGAWDGSLNLPLIGEKGMLTDGGIRTPFVAAWPGHIPAGQTYDHPVISFDVAATAVALAGLPHDDKLDGVNLIPFITGENEAAPHETLYWRWRSQAAVLEMPWKFIQLGENERYLFNVTTPDGETKNLIAGHADIGARLEAKLKTWSTTLQPPGPPEPNNDQDNSFFATHVDNTGTQAARRGTDAGQSDPPGSIQGWQARGGTPEVIDGALQITGEIGKKPFLTRTQLKLTGPATMRLSLKCANAGDAAIAWRTAAQKDFLPENQTAFHITASDDWQAHEVKLGAEGEIVHLRIHLPAGTTTLREIELQPATGKTVTAWAKPERTAEPIVEATQTGATPPSLITNAPYQNVFAKAIQAPAAATAYGEPAIAWHQGEYFLIYDNFGTKNGPACLMTSKDGVYWKEEGSILYPDPDHDDGCIECPDLRQFTPDGPFILSYDAKLKSGNFHVRRFAVSEDLRHWEKVAGVEFGADLQHYKQSPFYNQYSIANPDGGWFAVLNAAPKDFMGMGLARSQDGIHWECLPPLRATGVSDQQQGNAGPGCKAMEVSGVLKLNGRCFIIGGSPLAGADIILTSRDITGPYQPTPKNSIHLRVPQVFQRVYDLPGGYLSMPMLWATRENRRIYHVAPFRSVATDGESLWFKWWVGNEKLKVHPLPVSVEKETGPGGLRLLAEKFDPAQGLVMEATLSLPAATGPETNWARLANPTASSTVSRDWWPDGYFAPDKAIDGKATTAWRAPALDDRAWVLPDELAKAKEKPPVTFTLDLGEESPVGSIRIAWVQLPAKLMVDRSENGEDWSPLPVPPPDKSHGSNTFLENLNTAARFVRVTGTPGIHGAAIAEIAVSPEPFERAPELAGGLYIESKPGEGWAWFIERNGRVRFGKVLDGGTRFQLLKERDVEVDFGETAAIRLILRDDLLDLYVNDYQVDYYQLQGDPLSGRIGLFSPTDDAPKAWRPDPDYNETPADKKEKKR